VEGDTGLGLGLAQNLAAAGETVLDVPAKLAARARLLATGHSRKTDALDVVSVAAAAQCNTSLRTVEAEDDTVLLRLLADHRDDLVNEPEYSTGSTGCCGNWSRAARTVSSPALRPARSCASSAP